MLGRGKLIRNDLSTIHNCSDTFLRIFIRFCSERELQETLFRETLFWRFNQLCSQPYTGLCLKLMDENKIHVCRLCSLGFNLS